jgi:hypothetical protein
VYTVASEILERSCHILACLHELIL